MKTMYICLALLLGSNTLLAQPGLIKQPPKVSGVTNAVRNANARIHANSNTIYGAGKVKTDSKKTVISKSDAVNLKKKDEIKKGKGKKDKK
jgi:hypothetical protein